MEVERGGESVLTIQLLGHLAITRDGDPVDLPPSRKTRALLGYLVATGKPQRRDHLCELLWNIPDDPRGALRWSLSKIRAAVNEPGFDRIVTNRDSVSFDDVGVDIDLLAARKAVADGLAEVDAESLIAMEASFAGDFLAGLELDSCPEFSIWCATAREDCKALNAAILAALVARLAGEPNKVLDFARKWSRLDPANGEAHAALITALTECGRAAEARNQYQASRHVLEDLGQPEAAEDLPSPAHRPVGRRIGIARDLDQTAPEPARQIEQDIRFCTASDGVRIAYASVGKGMPLLKASNWLTHLEFELQNPVWRHWITALGSEYRYIRYDERGSGLSDWDAGDISFEAFVTDLGTVVDAVDVDKFALLGISRGCAGAIAYAAQNPERVSHLILYGGFARGWRHRNSHESRERSEALMTLMRHGWGQDNPAFLQVFASLFLPDGGGEQMRAFNDLMRVSTSPDNAFRIRNASSHIDVVDLLPKIQVPTLVIHSRKDAVCPFDEGRELATSIPGARFVPLESSNHLLQEDEPAWPRFLSEVHSFVNS